MLLTLDDLNVHHVLVTWVLYAEDFPCNQGLCGSVAKQFMLCSRYFSVVGSYSLYSSTWPTTWEGKVCDMF